MNDDEIVRRAKLILKDLKDLGLRPSGGILEEWMTHYVAEAISRLEREPTNTALSDECAATIAKLWELRDAQKQRELNAGVNWFLRQSNQVDEAAAQALRETIDRMTSGGEDVPAFDGKSSITFAQLGRLEEHALSVLWAATWHARRSANASSAETPESTEQPRPTDIFSSMEKPIFRSAQSELEKVFPEFKDLTLENYQLVATTVQNVLRLLDRVRQRYLDADIAADPSQIPDVAEMDAGESSVDTFEVTFDDDEPLEEEPESAD